MIKEAIEKIVSLAAPATSTIDGHTFLLDKECGYQEIKHLAPLTECIGLNSLDAIVQLIKVERKNADNPVFVSVSAHDTVRCFTSPVAAADNAREFLYKATAADIPGWNGDVKLPFEQAYVALMTRFQNSADREYTVNLLSQITTGAKITYTDNGIANTIVTSKGVSLQTNQQIRPIVKLRPFRTFHEVEQPEGSFLIRIDERGITFTEADGGMWKLIARQTIAEYLKECLKEEISSGKVVVTL